MSDMQNPTLAELLAVVDGAAAALAHVLADCAIPAGLRVLHSLHVVPAIRWPDLAPGHTTGITWLAWHKTDAGPRVAMLAEHFDQRAYVAPQGVVRNCESGEPVPVGKRVVTLWPNLAAEWRLVLLSALHFLAGMALETLPQVSEGERLLAESTTESAPRDALDKMTHDLALLVVSAQGWKAEPTTPVVGRQLN